MCRGELFALRSRAESRQLMLLPEALRPDMPRGRMDSHRGSFPCSIPMEEGAAQASEPAILHRNSGYRRLNWLFRLQDMSVGTYLCRD